MRVAFSSGMFRIDNASYSFTVHGGSVVANGTYYIAATYNGTTIALYLNGVLIGSAALSLSLTAGVAQIGLDEFSNFVSGTIDEIALYSYALSPEQIASRYAQGIYIYSPLIPALPSQIPLPNPNNKSVFGIGTYQSMSGGTTYAEGVQHSFSSVHHPYAGVYGGTYGFLVDTTIRAPQQTTYTPASEIGLDATGISVIRGFPQIVWSYTTMRPDFWYYLKWLYWQSAMNTPPPYQYLVLIQYPDTSGYNNPVRVLARMDPPTHSFRDVGAFYSVTLTFRYLGQAQLLPGTPITVI